jgi:predicted Zn-dependent protease
VIDSRLTLSADPADPEGGFIPFHIWGAPYYPVKWIDRGVLRDLSYSRGYALARLGADKGLENSLSFRLTPAPGVPTATVDEMVASTERGLLVTRLSGVDVLDLRSMLSTGYTRDGLWLIENGKITKPVKNFRFAESPMFVLNKVEDIGVPQRVFRPDFSYYAPALRVSDFSFVALADAV